MRLSIIMPAHNEEKRIEKTLKAYNEYFNTLKKRGLLDYEIIVVLNACNDGTLDIVNKIRKILVSSPPNPASMLVIIRIAV